MTAKVCNRSGTIYTGTCHCPACNAYVEADNQRRYAKRIDHGRNTPQWLKRTRPAVLKRDQHLCQLQLAGCTRRAMHVHRLPQYGTRHDSNLDAYLSACAHCHGVTDGGRAAPRFFGDSPKAPLARHRRNTPLVGES
jgi:5-methylcytosine-specific restriction endonuclease McrA